VTIQINIAEAKARLSALVEAAERGEEVVLARAGKPAARIVPVASAPQIRLGVLHAYGWTHDTPFEAFALEPEHSDWVEAPLEPDGA